MATREGFALIQGDVFVYQEINGLTSAAIGLDNADSGKLKLHVINGPGALPDASSQIIIDPTTGTVTIPSLVAPVTPMPTIEVTTTSASLAVNTYYIANNAGLVTLTLPASAVKGSLIIIVGKGAGGWLVAQNAGQTMYFSSATTTPGAGGSLASTQRRDCITLFCITANTEFEVISSIGNITVV